MKYQFAPQSRDSVKCLGESLSDILWQGSQWAVTTYGLECRDGRYHVEVSQFFNSGDSRGLHIKDLKDRSCFCWKLHMFEKNWVNQCDFTNALDAMCLLFNVNGKRSNIKPPQLCELDAIEEIASEAANRAYEETKRKAMMGLL
jgi:hypothetical protein